VEKAFEEITRHASTQWFAGGVVRLTYFDPFQPYLHDCRLVISKMKPEDIMYDTVDLSLSEKKEVKGCDC